MNVVVDVFAAIGFAFFGLSIFNVIVDCFSLKTKNDKNKKYTSSLAKHMETISLEAQEQKKIDKETYFETNIKHWKETRYFQFVLQSIKEAAEDGQKGIILTTWFNKDRLPTKTIYGEAPSPFNGYLQVYPHKYFSFTKEEIDSFTKDESLISLSEFVGNLEKYLKTEGFKVNYWSYDGILITWQK